MDNENGANINIPEIPLVKMEEEAQPPPVYQHVQMYPHDVQQYQYPPQYQQYPQYPPQGQPSYPYTAQPYTPYPQYPPHPYRYPLPPQPLTKCKSVLLSLVPPAFLLALQFVMAIVVTISTIGIGIEGDVLSVSLALSSVGSIILFFFMYRRSSRNFGVMERSQSSGMVWIILLMLTLNYFISSGIRALQDLLGTDLPISAFSESTDDTGTTAWLLLLTTCILIPIAEELCFRAVAFNYLMRRLKFWPANIIQAALFGLIHFIPIQMGYAFLVGLLLGLIYNRTGRLSAVFVGHIAFNSAIILLSLIPGFEDLKDNPGRMFLLIGLPSIAASIGLFALFYFRTSKQAVL